MDVSPSEPSISTGNGISSTSYYARPVTQWPDRLVKTPLGDPFFFGNTLQTVPIVVDLGSHRVRAGFANQSNPYCAYLYVSQATTCYVTASSNFANFCVLFSGFPFHLLSL